MDTDDAAVLGGDVVAELLVGRTGADGATLLDDAADDDAEEVLLRHVAPAPHCMPFRQHPPDSEAGHENQPGLHVAADEEAVKGGGGAVADVAELVDGCADDGAVDVPSTMPVRPSAMHSRGARQHSALTPDVQTGVPGQTAPAVGRGGAAGVALGHVARDGAVAGLALRTAAHGAVPSVGHADARIRRTAATVGLADGRAVGCARRTLEVARREERSGGEPRRRIASRMRAERCHGGSRRGRGIAGHSFVVRKNPVVQEEHCWRSW